LILYLGIIRKRYEKIDIGAQEYFQNTVSVGGTISTPTLWIADTIKITGNLAVNAKLTIAPGVLVQYQGYYDITLNDTLTAIGTSESPIRFSIKDTTGFSNKTNTNGRYKGLISNGPDGMTLKYCVFNYAERLSFRNTDNFKFENNRVEKCMADYTLLNIHGSNSIIKNNVFHNNDNVQGSYYKMIVADSYNCNIEGNIMYNNNTGAFENYNSNLRFSNNLIYNNNGGPIIIRSGYNLLFVNNTFVYMLTKNSKLKLLWVYFCLAL